MSFRRQYVWSGPSGGDFGDFHNWTPVFADQQAPGPDDLVIFNQGKAVTVDGHNGLVAEIDVVLGTTLTIQNGLEGNGSVTGVSLVVDSDGTVIVGSGAEVPDAGAVDVIGFSGAGTLDVIAGGALDDSGLVLGDRATGSGTVLIDGAGALLVVAANLPGAPNGQLIVGNAGAGDVTIRNGGSLGSINAVIGAQATAVGTVTLDAAKWDAALLTIGQSGKGTVTVQNGGVLTNAGMIIGSGGALDVSGTTFSTGTVTTSSLTLAGGTIDVTQGGIVAIGAATGPSGAVLVNSSVAFHALGLLNGNVVLNSQGTLEATGNAPGLLAISGNVTGSGTLEPLMTLDLKGAVAAGVAVVFSAPNALEPGVLVLEDAADEGGTISGFTAGNTIEITGPKFTNAVFAAGTLTNPGTLTLTGGSLTPLTLPIVGAYAPGDFLATPDATGTRVTLACFAAGTRITTSKGARSVERLEIGMRVHAEFAGFAPIKWIGHRTVDCRRHPDPHKVWPVRVRAGAFGPRLPRRDLWLSPDHAVFVNQVLIPIRCLINGTTVVQHPRDTVTYFHVELDRHDVLLAEGLPAESYLSTGNRSAFANGGCTVQLHPEFQSGVWEAEGCAPLVVTGPALEAARSRLSQRAASVASLARSRNRARTGRKRAIVTELR